MASSEDHALYIDVEVQRRCNRGFFPTCRQMCLLVGTLVTMLVAAVVVHPGEGRGTTAQVLMQKVVDCAHAVCTH